MINSTSNQQVKAVVNLQKKAKARREQQMFVVEGIKMVLEVPKEQLEKIYVAEHFQRENERLLEGKCVEIVSDQVFAHMSDTMTPQGILAVVRQKQYMLDEMTETNRPPLLMVLENLQDPGNLGTILRAGEGAGVTGVIMSRETVDIYNPKVIRSTMGSLFRVPFLYTDDIKEMINELKKRQIKCFAAHLKGQKNYDQENYRIPCAFFIGNEAGGLTDETAELADRYVKIPMEGQVESLNAAIASAVLMYEAARQRR